MKKFSWWIEGKHDEITNWEQCWRLGQGEADDDALSPPPAAETVTAPVKTVIAAAKTKT